MIATLKTKGLQSMEQIRAFLEGTHPLDFDAPSRENLYGRIAGEPRLCLHETRKFSRHFTLQ